MNEEEILRQKFGNQRPFSVPPGYFDDFASKLMQNLPDRETAAVEMKPVFWNRIRPYAAAASVAILLAGAGMLFWSTERHAENMANSNVQGSSSVIDYSIDEMADYAMLDNQDIYGLLSENI